MHIQKLIITYLLRNVNHNTCYGFIRCFYLMEESTNIGVWEMTMLAHEHKDLRMGPLHLSKNSGFPYGHACNSRTESTEESSKILKLTG